MTPRGIERRKRIWIDLDNTPHIPFFAPIIQELEARGYTVNLTARDAYQACELADLFKLNYQRVGRHYGRRRILKIFGTCFRALQLLRAVGEQKPDLAIAHGSRSQTIAASILNIPCLQITDYECAAPAVLAKPTWIMVPEVIAIPTKSKSKVLTYPGIKEDVYIPNFVPGPSVKAEFALAEEDVVVTVRPPANEAHYHNPASDELFEAVIALLSESPNVRVIILPRNERQEKSVRERWPDLFSARRLIIPEHATDGLNLIWYSDLVISGGGTMNREAAALGVPVYSIFRGPIGAVDRYLAREKRLVLLESVEDVRTKIMVKRRHIPRTARLASKSTINAVLQHIINILEGQASSVMVGSSRELGAC